MLYKAHNPQFLLQLVCLFLAVFLIILGSGNIILQVRAPIQDVIPLLIGNALVDIILMGVMYLILHIMFFQSDKVSYVKRNSTTTPATFR